MSSSIKFLPLYGLATEGPISYILSLDDKNILLDCGSTYDKVFYKSDPDGNESENQLFQKLREVDVVLLTHPTLAHIGGYLDFYHKHVVPSGYQVKIYSTLPLQNMGRMLMLDLLNSLPKDEFDEVPNMNSQSVNAAFDYIKALRYSQPTLLTGKCQDVKITAFNAGYTVGGTIWKIELGTDSVVYAPDFNHRKEKHLGGTAILKSDGQILEQLFRPTLLITGSYTALATVKPRKQIEQSLIDSIRSTLMPGPDNDPGCVLMPVDTSARVLELALLLDQKWEVEKLAPLPLLLVSSKAFATLKFAKSMLEWMGGNLAELFSNTRENPLDFKHVKLCQNIGEIHKFQGPKLILAASDGLDWGLSKQLLTEFAEDRSNRLILTSRGTPESLTRTIFNKCFSESAYIGGEPLSNETCHVELDLTINKQVLLKGDELAQFRHEEAERITQAKANLNSRNMARLDDSDDDSDTSQFDEDQILDHQFDVYTRDFQLTESRLPLVNRPTNLTFPSWERHRRRFDDYGEIADFNFPIDGEVSENLKDDDDINGKLNGRLDELDSIERYDQNDPTQIDPYPFISVSESCFVNLVCPVSYCGLEGRSDGRSIRTIVGQILVHGSQPSLQSLNTHFTNLPESGTGTIACLQPNLMEGLQVSTASKVHHFKLDDLLVSQTRRYQLGDVHLARFLAVVGDDSTGTNPNLDGTDLPHLLPPPLPKRLRTQTPIPTTVGAVQFATLRKLLQQQAIQAEFLEEGTLLCNNTVTIKKTDKGVQLIGRLGKDYYKVRKLLYKQQIPL